MGGEEGSAPDRGLPLLRYMRVSSVERRVQAEERCQENFLSLHLVQTDRMEGDHVRPSQQQGELFNAEGLRGIHS